MKFHVTLPYSPYRIQVDVGKGRTATVNLSANSPDLRAAYFGRSPRWRSILVSRAKQQMHDDAFLLTKLALGTTRRLVDPPSSVLVTITIRTRTRVVKDRDGALSGLKWAFDGIAQSLGGVNDSVFQYREVQFEKGVAEQTTIEVETG